MNIPEKVLYTKDAMGNVRRWGIAVVNGNLHIKYGVHGGVYNLQIEEIDEGLAGRTLEEQILLRMDSRIRKKIDAGMVESLETAQNQRRVNALGLVRPMTAKKYKDLGGRVDFRTPGIVQKKYNGLRCMITNRSGELIAYSRGGKQYGAALDHILSTLKNLPEGMTLDGELYCHGAHLQTLNSWAKKKGPESHKLKFIVYDMVSNLPFRHRLRQLEAFPAIELEGTNHPIWLADSFEVNSHDEVAELFSAFRSKGYEGAMLRIGDAGYESNKRSNSILKVKAFEDGEFLVVDIIPSSEGWAILACVTKGGKRFKVSAPGSVHKKFEIMNNPGKYIGRYVNVEFSELTKDGIPAQPVAKRWRDKADE